MDQSTVPHSEISIRLSICSEFLIDEKKSIKKAYKSLKEKLGEKIMEYSEFEYWFKRFQNNQFDLGYDTSLDEKEISEIPKESNRKINTVNKVILKSGIEIAKRIVPKVREEEKDAPTQIVDRNIEFTDQSLPQIFKKLVDKKKDNFKTINMSFGDSCCWLDFDELRTRFDRKNAKSWSIRYQKSNENSNVLKSNPEKFIVDHLWFVLKNSNIQLTTLTVEKYNSQTKFMNLKEFDFILKSMFNSFDNHQIHLTRLHIECLNADTFYTILKHLKPETLEEISFQIFEKGNFAKWREIVELEQWKRAKTISSPRHTPLTIDNVLHCKFITLACHLITSEDVVRVRDHFLESTNAESCTLTDLNQFINPDEIANALQSGDLMPKITRSVYTTRINFCYELPNSAGFLNLTLKDNKISFIKSCK